MTISPIAAVTASPADPTSAVALPPVAPSGASSFSELLVAGVEQVDAKLAAADAMTRAFALDDSIPLHQVTYAIEEARLSFELMMQVRNRLVEGYQELMRMQL